MPRFSYSAILLGAWMSMPALSHAVETSAEQTSAQGETAKIDPASTQAENADTGPNWKEDTLTGDWGGARSTLYKKGIELQFTHKSDVLSNVSGGLKRGTEWLGHTEARIALDLEKLAGWNSTTAYIHYHSDLGGKFNRDYVGGFMGVDNIEVGHNTAQFFHAWIQKKLFSDNLSVLGGIYPIDSEFYVTDTSGIFLAPPYGMSNEVAQTGKNGPPIFPIGALAVRVKFTSPGKNFYAMGAITDGVPGDPNNPNGTRIILGHGDGTLAIAELGYTPQHESAKPEGADAEDAEYFDKTAIGFWRYTSHFDDVDPTVSARHKSQGAYVLAERTLYTEKGHPARGLSGFVRFGTASDSVNKVDWTTSLGLRYHGLISGRGDDIAGVAVTVNHAGDRFRNANGGDSTETDWELTYRAQVKPWLAVQPNVQYIVNPGMDTTLKNAVVLGLRTEIAF